MRARTCDSTHRAFDSLGRGKRLRVDGRQPAPEIAELSQVAVNRTAGEVLEQVVVGMNPVEEGVGRAISRRYAR